MSPLTRGLRVKQWGMFTKFAKQEREFTEQGSPTVEHNMNTKAMKCFQNLQFDWNSPIWSSSSYSSIVICRIWHTCTNGDKWQPFLRTVEITWQRFDELLPSEYKRVLVGLQNERPQAEMPPPSVKLTLPLRVGLFCTQQDPNKILWS